MILEQVFSVKPERKIFMTEREKNMVSASRRAKRDADTVTEAHYGINVPQLVNTVQKLAEVMAKLLEREAEK